MFTHWRKRLFPPIPSEDFSFASLQAWLTMATALAVLFLYFLPEVVLMVIEDTSVLEGIPIVIGLISAGGAYLLSRTQRHHWGSYLLLGGWTLDLFLDMVFHPLQGTTFFWLLWMILALVMAFLLLSFRGFLVYAVGQFFLLLIAEVLMPVFQQAPMAFHVQQILLYTFAMVLMAISSYLYHRFGEERLALHRALENQHRYLQTVLDSIQSPLYVIDVQTYRIKLANKAARRLGISENAQIATCYQLTHRRETPCDGLEHPCPLQKVTESREPYTVEHIHYRPDGTPYFVEVHGYPIFDAQGRVVEMVEYSIDITERKRTEAQIRKLQQAIEHAASGVLITDPEGVIEYVNPAMEKMTGYSREELIGQTPRLLKSGKMPREVYADLWSTIKAGRVWQGELINRRKDGSLYFEFQTIAPVTDEKGRITHFVAIKQDVTRQKEMEEALRKAKERAEAASRFKSQLLANLSHDMRTPLGIIIGFSEMLLDGALGPLNGGQQEKVRAIMDTARHLNQRLANLLHQADLESGQLRLRPRPFTVRELLKGLTSSLAMARWKGLQVHTEVDPHLPDQLYGDLYWMEQILINLVENAIKYTEQGAVWIRFKRVDDRRWAVEVEDTGIGIPPEQREMIFHPFRRGTNAASKAISGAGLGLAIVKQLVEMMDGEIRLESEPGKGSKFTIIFPLGGQDHEK